MSDDTMTGFRTTYQGMFGDQAQGFSAVAEVEIPLIQRDYAQGRQDPRTSAIRGTFLDALHGALTTDASVGLDFIYGEVRGGRFEPLDGQQRLTTMFLLHWYLAFRRGDLGEHHPWTRFTYATRPSARLFCERIVRNPPPRDLAVTPSVWITDQSWYLHLWRFDPTISAMLVTLDAIDHRFSEEDADVLWGRLVDEEDPAVWFQLLPIDEMGAAEDLYIKMNSRGKPLTQFEGFKAYLGQLVAETDDAHDFGHKIDGVWTDLFWPYRGENDIVDDEVMRYFDFVIEVSEWREGRLRDESLTPERRVAALLAQDNPRRQEHLSFLCSAFDAWLGDVSIEEVFAELFKTANDGPGVRLVGAASTNLFATCCDTYGAARGATRLFSLTDTLLLYAVLVHRIHDTADPAGRLRSLRNVNEASQFEMRVQNMPKFISEVTEFMHTGDLACLATFNQNQVADEALKRELRKRHPELACSLERLEDHTILRGTLAAFDLDSSIATRAAMFEAVFDPRNWPLLTGALLATGEYQRDYPGSDQHRFGSPTTESVWRLLLVDRGDRASLGRMRAVLAVLLDDVARSDGDPREALTTVADSFVRARSEARFLDWRYYLVRYPAMREGNSGIYYGAEERIGYELTMLRKTVQRSWYRDAYLYAMWCESGNLDAVTDPWFYGYSTTPRWMTLTKSGVGLRSVPDGIIVKTTESSEVLGLLAAVADSMDLQRHDDGWLLRSVQKERAGAWVDSEDRVQRGAALIAELVSAGL
jgi:hypothetical protein